MILFIIGWTAGSLIRIRRNGRRSVNFALLICSNVICIYIYIYIYIYGLKIKSEHLLLSCSNTPDCLTDQSLLCPFDVHHHSLLTISRRFKGALFLLSEGCKFLPRKLLLPCNSDNNIDLIRLILGKIEVGC